MDHEDDMHGAMAAVLDDMGKAARERKARRFTGSKRPMHKGVEVKMGEVTLEPTNVSHQPHLKLPDGMTKPMDIDPDESGEHGMSSADMDDLARDLEVQR